MKVIAESGSTKCDWLLIENGVIVHEVFRKGYNPRYDSFTKLEKQLETLPSIFREAKKVKFYGAGCSTKLIKDRMKFALGAFFNKAMISVESDIQAVVDATCDGKPGICAILGTGSNSCYFDGEDVSFRTPSLGYLFSDEGSGFYHGKELLKMYFFGKFKPELQLKFEEQFGMIARDRLLDEVYRKENARSYISSFMPFIFEQYEDEQIAKLHEQCLRDFIERFLSPYEDIRKDLEVHFVGSVAYLSQDKIRQLLREYGFSSGKFIRNPIKELI